MDNKHDFKTALEQYKKHPDVSFHTEVIAALELAIAAQQDSAYKKMVEWLMTKYGETPEFFEQFFEQFFNQFLDAPQPAAKGFSGGGYVDVPVFPPMPKARA